MSRTPEDSHGTAEEAVQHGGGGHDAMSPQEHQVRHRQRQLGHRPKDRRHAEQLSVVGRRDSTDPKRRTEPGMRGERASSHDHERLMTDHEHESHPRVQWSVRAGASGREFTSSWRTTSRGGSELTCDGGGSRVRRLWRATPSGSGIGTPETPFHDPRVRARRCREGGGSGPGCDDPQQMSPFTRFSLWKHEEI